MWIVGFPYGLAHCEPAEVECVVAEGEFDLAAGHGGGLRVTVDKHFVHAPTGSLIAVGAAVEGHAVAPLHATGETDRQVDDNPVAPHAPYRAKTHTAFRTADRRHQPLVIDAAKPTAGEAPGKGEFHLLNILWGEAGCTARDGLIDRPPVVAGDVGHILWGLQAAFNLQRADARLEELGNQGVASQVLR